MKRILCGMAVAVLMCTGVQDAKAYYAVGNTVSVDQKEDAALPVLLTTEIGYTVDKDESTSNVRTVSEKISYMDLWDGAVRPYVVLGVSKFKDQTDGIGDRTDNEFIWGLGVDAILKECNDQNLALFGSIGYRETEIDYEEIADDNSTVRLFQTSLGLVKTLGSFDLYAGLSYWHVETKSFISSTSVGQNTEDELVPFLGVNYELNETVSLGLELNQVNDDFTTAVSCSVQF